MIAINNVDDLITLSVLGVSICLSFIAIVRLFTRYWLIENKKQFSLFILLSLSMALWALSTLLTRSQGFYAPFQCLTFYIMAFCMALYLLALRKRLNPAARFYPFLAGIFWVLASGLLSLMLTGWQNPFWIMLNAVAIISVFGFNVIISFQLAALESNGFYKFVGLVLGGFSILYVIDNLSGLLWNMDTHLSYLAGSLIFIVSFGVFIMDQAYHTATHDLNRRIAEVEEEFAAAVENTENVVVSLARAIEAKDRYTEGHSARVSQYAVCLGRSVGLDDNSLERLRIGGLVHDIGKIGIAPQVLNKPGKLNDEERRLIESHPVLGENICSPLKSFADINPLILYHHEKLDGSGYPDGLEGADIPLEIRIITIADIYDALTTDRPYRAGMNHNEASRILKLEAAGGKLDPALVEAFIHLLEENRGEPA